jgi:aspartate/methionine/tyrosine aminotransferase
MLYSKQNLVGIADLANDYDFHVLADKLYKRLVYDGAPTRASRLSLR